MRTIKKTSILFGILFVCCLFTNTANAQKITVKGIVKGQTETIAEALNGANIYLNDKSASTTSNRKGEFTFPKALKVGDVLVFSYLGYLNKKVTITEKSTYLTIVLKEDDNEMLGAVATTKRFKSKRKAQ